VRGLRRARQVLKAAGTSLPPAALYVVRFHSFYAWHSKGAYLHLCDEADLEMLPWVRAFQKCDLYSKRKEQLDISALRPYYETLADKYIPGGVLRW